MFYCFKKLDILSNLILEVDENRIIIFILQLGHMSVSEFICYVISHVLYLGLRFLIC